MRQYGDNRQDQKQQIRGDGGRIAADPGGIQPTGIHHGLVHRDILFQRDRNRQYKQRPMDHCNETSMNKGKDKAGTGEGTAQFNFHHTFHQVSSKNEFRWILAIRADIRFFIFAFFPNGTV